MNLRFVHDLNLNFLGATANEFRYEDNIYRHLSSIRLDVFAVTLYRIFSNISVLNPKSKSSLSIEAKETDYIGYGINVEGKFKVKKGILFSGTANDMEIAFKSPQDAVKLNPFPLVTINDASINTDHLFASGLSVRNAEKLAKKSLKGDDTIVGSESGENIRGFKGDDTIIGGGGIDFLRGGRGRDVFKYTDRDDAPIYEDEAYGQEREIIYKFESNKDKIDLSELKGSGKWKNKRLSIVSSSISLDNFWEDNDGPVVIYSSSRFYVYLDPQDKKDIANTSDNVDMTVELDDFYLGVTISADNFIV